MARRKADEGIPFVETVVTVSLLHLSREDRKRLEAAFGGDCPNGPEYGVDVGERVGEAVAWAVKAPSGWVMRLLGVDPEVADAERIVEAHALAKAGWSETFADVLGWAIGQRYHWVRFDADAPPVPGIKCGRS